MELSTAAGGDGVVKRSRAARGFSRRGTGAVLPPYWLASL